MKRNSTVWQTLGSVAAIGICVSMADAQTDMPRPGPPPPPIGSGQVILPPRETSARSNGIKPLKREISLRLDSVSLETAINTIARQGGLDITYRQQLMRGKPRVSLPQQTLTVEDAFSHILRNTGLHLVVLPNGRVVISDKPVTLLEQGTGALFGRVIGLNGGPLAEARVQVVGTKLVVLTNADGQFRIPGLAQGQYTVRVTLFGFKPVEQSATVAVNGDNAVSPITLTGMPTKLSEVVTTATGEQRRVELGNSIATIKADSLITRQPITSLAELLAARAPGVQVMSGGGSAGAPSRIRIRGAASSMLNNDPIVVIDGVRINAITTSPSAAQNKAGLQISLDGRITSSNRPVPSPLDNIDINSIESIDILKGPSASSLYGTDAANGVIVIKTRRGRPGQTRFNIVADHGTQSIPKKFPDKYVGWGPSGLAEPAVPQCSLRDLDNGLCQRQDSVTHFNPNNFDATSTYGTGALTRINANVSGGWPQLQHFLSLTYFNEVGMAKMPDVEVRRMLRSNIPVPGWLRRPNVQQQIAATSRLTNQPRPGLDLSLTTDVRQLEHRDASNGILSDIRTLSDTLLSAVGDNMAERKTDNHRTILAALQANYVPRAWLSLRTSLGVENSDRHDESLRRPGTCLGGTFAWQFACDDKGERGIYRGDVIARSSDVGTTLTLPLATWVTSRSSIGGQYNRTRTQGTRTFAEGLTYGTEAITGALKTVSDEEYSEHATAGWYLEQQFSLRDRLFLRAGFRRDAGSAFGKDANVPVYPKVDGSWVVSEEPFFPAQNVLTRARVRLAFGHSGQQPTLQDITRQYSPRRAIADSQIVQAIHLRALGNYRVRPERGVEWEGGADISLFNERITMDLTLYRKVTQDALHTRTLPPSVGANYQNEIYLIPTRLENLGTVENRGTELSMNMRLLDRQFAQWDLTVGASANRNMLLKLGKDVVPFGTQESRMTEGYPLFGQWAYPLRGYRDLSGDGVLQDYELIFGDSMEYMGSSLPTSEVSYQSTWALLNSRLRISTMFRQVNGLTNINVDAASGQRGLYDRTAPLALQAFARSSFFPGASIDGGRGSVSYLRFAELSVGYDMPQVVVKPLRLRSASILLMGRNLGLWTRYSGMDPEVNTATAIYGGDALLDRSGTPQPRSWSLRINLGY